MKKERLDVLLVDKGLVESREKAKALIMTGMVIVSGNKEEKPGTKVNIESDIRIKGKIPYVSRGGYKLEKAIKEFKIILENKKAIDVGASMGGFTDCMLQNSAAFVTSIDVGYGQLAWSLQQNDKVKVMDRTNIRYVKIQDIGYLADFITIDVSFISLKKVLPIVYELLDENGEVVCLIKPQFEAGKDKVGKNGVVRDSKIHIEVLEDILNYVRDNNWHIINLTYSPIKGPKGNIEFLLYIKKSKTIDEVVNNIEIKNIINKTKLEL